MAGRRLDLHAAIAAMKGYERELSEQLIAELQAITGVTIWGIADPSHSSCRERRRAW